MPKICYQPRKFNRESLSLIELANSIIHEYRRQGYTLTLRQLYYQFVARDLIPNSLKSYKRLGKVVSDARLAGLIDWFAIEDRTRWLRSRTSWSSPAEIVNACASQFHLDRWANQSYRPEVWIEKDALIGVIEGVCNELDVPFFACRGYVSQSEQWRAGRRWAQHQKEGQRVVVLHFGDHDPSGIDMTRDNDERGSLFAGTRVDFRRLALNRDQVDEYNPPPNPAKLTDSRARDYVAEHGRESWELDALEPSVINGLIRRAVSELIDPDEWEETEQREQAARERIAEVAEQLQEDEE